jgi:hypothetical protein
MIGPDSRAPATRHRPRRRIRLATLAAITLLVAGCSSGAAAAASGRASSVGPAVVAPSTDPSRSSSAAPTPSPSASPDPTPVPVAPSLNVTWPAAGTAGSAPAAGDALAWTSTDAIATDVTEEHTTGTSSNVDCAGASWQPGPAPAGQRSPVRIADARPGHCYRFVVTARSSSGGVATARSGTLWIEPAWRGGVDLYRSGVFATQQTFDWCVPAAVEMVRNIVDGRSIHGYAEQAALYRYGRAHLYTDYPVPGLDPKATAAVLAHLGQAYGDYRGATLDAMEREAVRQLRRMGKPVILYVDAGIHAWVLDGFTATADPAVTDAFTITSFSVLGPLWPTQQYHAGYYDMPPDTKLSPSSFAAAVRAPYHERTRPVPWEGWFVITEPL